MEEELSEKYTQEQVNHIKGYEGYPKHIVWEMHEFCAYDIQEAFEAGYKAGRNSGILAS